MDHVELIPHLFRIEYRKIVSVLSKRFGFEQIEVAEDIASDTFLTATQAWGVGGVPPNPTAWLYHVARNKAKTYLQRNHVYENKIVPVVKDATSSLEAEIDLSPQNINDSQLQMMFAVCHPAIPTEAQVGLALRILCGFGIEEIADAFITNKDTINKRLLRGKEKLREQKIKIELPDAAELEGRMAAVLTTIYLLFNEGYYSVSQNSTVRKELCLEAMRLCTMLVENKITNTPAANALLSLMCFHTSRFDARLTESGELILYEDQDTSLWNTEWINKGGYFLSRSASGNKLSKYHLEAGIAYWHTQKNSTKEKWENILQLYNQLLQIEYSPMAALNRTYALSRANGKRQALVEAEKLQLTGNHFYFMLLGDLYTDLDPAKAKRHYEQALTLAKTPADKQAIQKKLDAF
ncbi:RNA polymerase sigma factor [Chryseolinea soli]|uniref:Sigma-70 family RNA polymerase sigma factor n=1 Tax=Chryseolinea soli TaxID=2321403 RepID=A0A385SPC9_9BACT|nr:sigma-70 family RNA polymerase sigma factor [Chryseolinea soli]AYB33029.1 sigma-70 family RNA polymerase sigma factor [Chryseolinea soli]